MNAQSNSYASWFTSRVEALMSSHADEPCILAFLGMSPLQAQLLAKTDECLMGMVDANGFYNPEEFKQLKKKAFMQCLGCDSSIVMLYEQLLEIKGSLADMFDGTVYVVRNNLFLSADGYPSAVRGSELAVFAEELNATGKTSGLLAKYYAAVQKCNDNYLTSPILPGAELNCVLLNLYEGTKFEAVPASSSTIEVIPAASAASLVYRLKVSNGQIHPATIEIPGSSSQSAIDDEPMRVLAVLAKEAGLPVTFLVKRDVEDEVQDTGLLLPILQRYWGAEARFRKLSFYSDPDFSNEMERVSQGAICEFAAKQAMAAHQGSDSFRDILLTAPTGAGKSILFQLPALYLAKKLETVTLVIEPLKALMTDQVANLRARGVKNVVAINSDIPYGERIEAYEKIKDGRASIVYLSPELLLESSLDTILSGRELGLVVVDEVHTVTSWGKDFRPDYWYLGPYLTKLRKTGTHRFPIFALPQPPFTVAAMT